MKKKIWALACIGIILSAAFSFNIKARADIPKSNRYNIVFAIDNSASMRHTDHDGYRFSAVEQFIGLLQEDGHQVGGLLFAPNAFYSKECGELNSMTEKAEFVAAMKNAGLRDGGTNIGAALQEANRILEVSGDKNLPSVIVLLSDGNTDLRGGNAKEESLQLKAQEVQNAIDRNIPIYTVCLNMKDSSLAADPEEMRAIATATGGAFTEVNAAEDLGEAFSAFYDLIYGTHGITLADTKIPESGKMDVKFEVPSFGIDEINLLVTGTLTGTVLIKPDGTEGTASKNVQKNYTIMKIKDRTAGTWTLGIEGKKGSDVKVTMVLNTSIDGELPELKDEDGQPVDFRTTTYFSDKTYRVSMKLTDGTQKATTEEEYQSFRAVLRFYYAQSGEKFLEKEMSFESGAFTYGFQLSDIAKENGAYTFDIAVEGSLRTQDGTEHRFFEKTLPMSQVWRIAEEEIKNTAPKTVIPETEITVKLWPFKGGEFSLDLNTLFEDAEGDALVLSIQSPFTRGTDYEVSTENILTQTKFSFRSGTYKITATDPWGETAEAVVNVKTISITLVALLSMVGAGLIVAAILITLLIIALKKPFYGEFEVYTVINGV